MGKIVKGFIIGACISIAVGFVLFIGAAVAGGLDGAREIIKDGGITIGVSSGDLDFAFDTAEGTEKTEKYTLSTSDMKTPDLELELDAGDFEIIRSDGADIVVKSTKGMDVESDGDTVKIRSKHNLYLMKVGFFTNGNEVTIEIPKDMQFEDVNIQIGAGELRCPELICETLNMEIGAGVLYMDAFVCKEVVTAVGAGEIIVENGVVDDMDMDVGVGNFSFRGIVKEDLDADCGMGNVQMWLEGSQADHNYQIDCGMGNIVVGDTSYGGVATDKDIDNGASSEFDLDCGMGNLEIRFES